CRKAVWPSSFAGKRAMFSAARPDSETSVKTVIRAAQATTAVNVVLDSWERGIATDRNKISHRTTTYGAIKRPSMCSIAYAARIAAIGTSTNQCAAIPRHRDTRPRTAATTIRHQSVASGPSVLSRPSSGPYAGQLVTEPVELARK